MNAQAIKKNFIYGIIYQLAFVISGLIVRKLFTLYLDVYFLGVNSVFDNVFGLLNLLSFGFGSSCLYFLYKAFSTKSKDEFIATYLLFKKYFRRVSLAVFVVGLIILLNINWIINTTPENIDYLRAAFFVIVLKSSLTYLLTCQRETLQCDEKRYYNLKADFLALIIFLIFKCLILIYTQSYIGYLILCLLEMIASNLYISICFKKTYSNVDFKKRVNLTDKSKQIRNYAKSLTVANANYFIYSGTDNIVLSKICGTITVGLISNYYSIAKGITSASSILTNAVTSSVIKKINISDVIERKYSYSVLTFFSYVIGSFISLLLFGLTDTFISLYYGSEFVMEKSIILFMAFNAMLEIFQFGSNQFIIADGLINKELRFSIPATIINIFLSISLAILIGPAGVLIGTTIANLLLLFGRDIIINQYSIKLDLKTILKKYALIVLTVLQFIIVSLVSLPNTVFFWIIKAIICFVVWLLFLLILYNWKECKLFFFTTKDLIKRMKK